MIKTGTRSLDRLWFVANVINHKDNTREHLNLINEWIERLYGIDGLYDIRKPIISGDEYYFWTNLLINASRGLNAKRLRTRNKSNAQTNTRAKQLLEALKRECVRQ